MRSVQSMTTRTTALPPGTSPHQEPFPRAAPLLEAALLLGVGGGFILATILTLTYALAVPLGPWWTALAQAHGHLQLYGWAGLFVLGVAFHFLPRLRGTPLAAPWLVPWILGLQIAGLLLRALGQPLVTTTQSATWRVLALATWDIRSEKSSSRAISWSHSVCGREAAEVESASMHVFHTLLPYSAQRRMLCSLFSSLSGNE